MNHDMDAVANTNANINHDPDFKTFWKQLHGKWWVPKTVFTPQYPPAEHIDCYSVTPKRMEYWDLAIEAGFTFADLESMAKRHKPIALSPRVLLNDPCCRGCGQMHILSLNLEFGNDDQFGEEDKQAIRFVIQLSAEHPHKSSFDKGIRLHRWFVEIKQLHNIPLVTHHVELSFCDLVDCDKLMFNISQHSKCVRFSSCELANGGADLCRWLSPKNCSVTEISFVDTRFTCDSLAKLFRSNKRIDRLTIGFYCFGSAEQICPQQEIDPIIKLLSNASHLKKLQVCNFCTGLSRQEQMIMFDTLISLLRNKGLSSLLYGVVGHPGMFEVPTEILSAQMEVLQQALEETSQLTYLHIDPRPRANEHAHWYDALVERILRRNHRNKVRAVLCSLPTWSRPQALFGEMLMRTNKRRGIMGSTNETFNILLQGSEMLKRA